MSKPLEGVRVIEVAAWTFVPVAGAMLADMGADVIKVEPPNGDPQRGLLNMLNAEGRGPNPFIEIPNRGKRSITLDLANESGHGVLMRLAATNAARSGAEVARIACGLAGTASIYTAHSLAQAMCDSLVVAQHAFLSEGTLQSAGRILLGLPGQPGFP